MNLKKSPASTPPKTIPLAKVPGGDTFRFAHDSEESIIEDGLLYMKVDAPEIKDGRARIVNCKDGRQLDRDGDRLVVLVSCTIHIDEVQPQ